MASMVVIFFPATAATGVTHERIGCPSRCTVQAPQSAMPQPNFVPVRPTTSRSTHRTGMSAGDRKSTRLNSSHDQISYAVFCLKKKKKKHKLQLDDVLRSSNHQAAFQLGIILDVALARP